jgi:site-specific recombinase XerD
MPMASEVIIRDQPGEIAAVAGADIVLPLIIALAGDRAARRFLEFFAATIRNANTREAYYRACCRFFAWCEQNGLDDLPSIEPLHVAAYVEALGLGFEKPTVKQHLAAIRMLFDWLVTGGILAVNPAAPVRGPKHVVRRGKTPVLSAAEATELLDSIDTGTAVGLRDRTLIALMTYTFARVSAAVEMQVEDYYSQGKRWWVRLHEKGVSAMKYPRTTTLKPILTPTLKRPGSRSRRKLPSSARRAAVPAS